MSTMLTHQDGERNLRDYHGVVQELKQVREVVQATLQHGQIYNIMGRL